MKAEILEMMKRNLIKVVIVLILVIILVVTVWRIIIDEGSGKKHNNPPSTYKNNAVITNEGIKIDNYSIIDEALINIGYTDEQIENIRTNLISEGYTGDELEEKILQRKLEILGLDPDIDISKIGAAELLFLLDEKIYSEYLENEEQLEYLMNAELVTQMPHLDYLEGTDKLNGTIYFERQTEDNKKIDLKYIEEETFEELIRNSDSSVLKYFTMTEDNEIKIAYYQEESGSISTNDTTVNVSEYDSRFTNDTPSFNNSSYITTSIPYSTMVPEKYSLPFDYLWALLVLSKDYNFVKGLADLAYNSEIVITVYDNVTENKTVTTYEYSRQQIDYSQIKLKEETETTSTELDRILNTNLDQETENKVEQQYRNLPTREDTTTTNMDNQPIEVEKEHDIENYYVKKEIYAYTNLVETKLTYANVWIIEYTTEYNYYEDGEKIENREPDNTQKTVQGQDTSNEINGTRLTRQLLKEEPTETNSTYSQTTIMIDGKNIVVREKEIVETEIDYKGDKWSELNESKVDVTEELYMHSVQYINDSSKTNIREKTDIEGKVGENFCSLLNNSSKKENILSYQSWLIEMLESNEETADMVDLTKYLIGKVQDPENTDLSYDFSIYSPSSFNTYSYGNILTEYLNAWENGAVRNYLNGNSSYTSYVQKYITEDKKYYYCYTDGNNTRNYGFGVCHWTGSGWNLVDAYSSLGVNIQDSKYNTTWTSKLEVEIVDKVRDQVISNNKQYIIDILQKNNIDLTENQIDALTAVKYQYGNIGNFVEAYNSNPDTIRANFIVNGCKPFLTGYNGGKDRATANWKVYNEGIYTDRAGNEIVSVSGAFLTVAQETWAEVCKRCTNYGGTTIPVTGATIDCSSYVSWVLYNYGYTEFGGHQTTSELFYKTNWNSRYGWEEIPVASMQNPISILKPGDIFVRYEGTGNGQTHHVLIVAGIENGRLMAFDCGNSKNWKNNAGNPIDRSYFLTESGNGKIIRVTK